MNEDVKKKEKQRVIDLYYKGCSRNSILEITELSNTKVDKYLREEGLKYKNWRVTELHQEMIKFSFEQGYSVKTISEVLGFKQITIKKYIKKLTGVSWKDNVKDDEKELFNELRSQGFTITQINKLTGRARSTIRKHLKRDKDELKGGNDDV